MKRVLGIILAIILGLGTLTLLWVSMGFVKMIIYIVFMAIVCFLIYLCVWLLLSDEEPDETDERHD